MRAVARMALKGELLQSSLLLRSFGDGRGGLRNRGHHRSVRCKRVQIGEALLDFRHTGDELLLDLLAIAVGDDAQTGGVANDVRGQREQTSDQALILERAQVERSDLV